MRGNRTTLLLCCLAQLMVTLDSSILAVALPDLKTELGFSAATLPWVVNAFAIPIAGLLLFSGRLSDRLGSRRVLTIGVVTFTLTSLGAGLAPTSGALIVGRVGQGVGAALMTTACLALLSQTFLNRPGHKRSAYGAQHPAAAALSAYLAVGSSSKRWGGGGLCW